MPNLSTSIKAAARGHFCSRRWIDPGVNLIDESPGQKQQYIYVMTRDFAGCQRWADAVVNSEDHGLADFGASANHLRSGPAYPLTSGKAAS